MAARIAELLFPASQHRSPGQAYSAYVASAKQLYHKQVLVPLRACLDIPEVTATHLHMQMFCCCIGRDVCIAGYSTEAAPVACVHSCLHGGHASRWTSPSAGLKQGLYLWHSSLHQSVGKQGLYLWHSHDSS